MGQIIHRAYMGMIWLTAVMTLIAGFPHFECHCANGHVKPYCLSILNKTGCCCDGSCCSALPREGNENVTTQDSPSDQASEKSCCCQESQRSFAGSPKEPSLERMGCQKISVKAADAVPSVPKIVAQDSLGPSLQTPPPCVLLCPQDGVRGDQSAYFQWLPPPTDLVIVLQHFLI
jgi:hypothetical protein